MSLNLFLADKLSPLVLATQPKLLSVNLTNNLISDVQPGAFANMTRLVRLILTKNKIAKLEEGSLQGSHTLGLQSSDRGTSPLSPFTSVLNNPPISGLVNLVELDLSNNFLTKVPMVALAALNNLKFLNLGSNKIQVMLVIVIPRLQFLGNKRKTHGLGFSLMPALNNFVSQNPVRGVQFLPATTLGPRGRQSGPIIWPTAPAWTIGARACPLSSHTPRSRIPPTPL